MIMANEILSVVSDVQVSPMTDSVTYSLRMIIFLSFLLRFHSFLLPVQI